MTTTAPAARRATYRQVLAEPRFRLLLVTRSLAIGADTLRTVALSVLIFTATGSPLLAAVTYGAAFLPQAIGGTLFGALADRIRPRPLITAGYGLEAATAAALALAGLPAGASLALVAAIATLTPVFGGASSRLIAEVLGGDAYVLGRSLANIAASASQLLGLAAGGAAIAALGARHALLATAACHLAAAAAIRLRLPALPAPAKPPGQPPASVLRQSWTVNRQLITDPAVRILLLATWLPPAFLTGAESLIVPYAAPARSSSQRTSPDARLRPRRDDRGRLHCRQSPAASRPRAAHHPPHDGGRAAAARIRRRAHAASRRRPADRYRYRPRLHPRDPALLPGRGAAPVLGQAFGLLTTGLMTFQGAGPALFGAVTQITSAGRAMALAGLATIVTALTLFPAFRERRRPGRQRPRASIPQGRDPAVRARDAAKVPRSALPPNVEAGGPRGRRQVRSRHRTLRPQR
jgi:hypothetical protein